MSEAILITLLGVAADIIKDRTAKNEPVSPEAEAAWDRLIAAKEEAQDAAIERAKKR